MKRRERGWMHLLFVLILGRVKKEWKVRMGLWSERKRREREGVRSSSNFWNALQGWLPLPTTTTNLMIPPNTNTDTSATATAAASQSVNLALHLNKKKGTKNLVMRGRRQWTQRQRSVKYLLVTSLLYEGISGPNNSQTHRGWVC